LNVCLNLSYKAKPWHDEPLILTIHLGVDSWLMSIWWLWTWLIWCPSSWLWISCKSSINSIHKVIKNIIKFWYLPRCKHALHNHGLIIKYHHVSKFATMKSWIVANKISQKYICFKIWLFEVKTNVGQYSFFQQKD